MRLIQSKYNASDADSRRIILLFFLLPPPVSLDTLYTISNISPVKILQMAEDLVQTGYLARSPEDGPGYYHLTEPEAYDGFFQLIPLPEIQEVAKTAIAHLSEKLADGPRKWLHLAHLYQHSLLAPGQHARELIRAGDYCRSLNLSADGAVYYRLALEAMESQALAGEEPRLFIDGTIGICTSSNNALSPKVQLRLLKRAFAFSSATEDLESHIRLTVLTARALVKLGRYDEATQHFEQARELIADGETDMGIRLETALAHSEFLFWQGLITDAIDRYESVIDIHEQLPLDLETLRNCAVQGWIYGIAGETARGIGLIEAVRERAREIGADELTGYATLLLVFVFADARRLNEAELYLKEVFNTPEFRLDHYMLWPGNGKLSFLACCRGDYQAAFKYQHLAYEHSKALGFIHHRGPDNFEIMLTLEKMGMVHPEWNFASEVERLQKWPDIYMRGSMLRYRARKKSEDNRPASEIKADLQESIGLLTRSGANIELALARIALAQMYLKDNKVHEATELLRPSWDILAKANPDLFPEDLKHYLDPVSKNELWVDSLVQIGAAIGSVREKNQLLAQIIKQAMRLTGAERGAIFLKKSAEVEVAATRNFEQVQATTDFLKLREKVINKVFESGTEFLHQETICRPNAATELCTKGWLGCFPITMQGRISGVIYMECRMAQQPLSNHEASLLRIVSNQAAVALENVEAFAEINELKNTLEAETHFYRESRTTTSSFSGMLGRSPAFLEVQHLIEHVAASDTTVMITGETGVGKDLVAQAIHQRSDRSSGPFIAVNVVALSPELIASELFGHEKGAFTGASQPHKGRFELANNGTLFLDDIDAFTLEIQAKMLRVLETKTFERVGGSDTLSTTFRLIATSNRRIEKLVEQGKFRSDFYYRLNVYPIHVPPLRERREDIPLLTHHFVSLFAKRAGKRFDSIPPKIMQRLEDYDWPGNVRELRHVIERSVLLSQNNRFLVPPLDAWPGQSETGAEKILPLHEMEAQHILKALQKCRGRVSGEGGAAQLLGLKPTTLSSKMKKLGIAKSGYHLQQ